MRIRCHEFGFLFTLAVALAAASPARSETQVWRVTDGTTSISLAKGPLEGAGLRIAHTRATALLDDDAKRVFSGPVVSFHAMSAAENSFVVKNGAFTGFAEGANLVVAHEGGLTLAPIEETRSSVLPVFLYDFSVEIDPALGASGVRLVGGSDASPFEVRSASFLFDAHANVLRVLLADLHLTEAYARSIGIPDLAGDWVGTLDMILSATLVRSETTPQETEKTRSLGSMPLGSITDVKLGELYGLNDVGRIGGAYPTGTLGLAMATTSCNVGDVDVPWREPMDENHPTIGQAMFRLMNDRLEMIGKAWSKHGFFALSSSQCTACQHFSNGTFLGVGCSDTYAVSNNSSQFYLSGRSEVNPHRAMWECTGSYFDGTPVDCIRSNNGSELNAVQHRLEVLESDLMLPGATYTYEGCYYVQGDADITNNIGWKSVTMTHPSGNTWNFTTPGGITPNYGPVVLTWGDVHDTESVQPNDGQVMLSTKVTDLGGGTWHYEWAFYNRTSDRGIREFSVPVGSATLTNIGFRDIDQVAGNDWGVTAANGLLTWSTGTEGEPGANPLTYQTLFNFRFDADMPPQTSQVRASTYKLSSINEVYLDTQSPYSGATDVVVSAGAVEDFELRSDPNPFAQSTQVSFAMPATGKALLTVTDVSGRTIRTLFEGEAEAGQRTVTWDGRDSSGRAVSSGIYFFRIESEGRTRTIKGTLLK